MSGPYDDILNLPHPVSWTHPRQPMEKRAAQFAPFAALTGYDDAVEETARYTEERQEPEEEALMQLNAALIALQQREREHPVVRIERFVPDAHKTGGSYRTCTVCIKRVDAAQACLFLTDGTQIAFRDISRITCPAEQPEEA